MVLKITAAFISCTLNLHHARSAALQHPYMSILPFNLAVNGSTQALVGSSTVPLQIPARVSHYLFTAPSIRRDRKNLLHSSERSESFFIPLPFPHTFPPASSCTPRHPRGIHQRTRRNGSATDTYLLPLDVCLFITAAPRPKDIATHSSYNDSRSSYSDIGCVLGTR